VLRVVRSALDNAFEDFPQTRQHAKMALPGVRLNTGWGDLAGIGRGDPRSLVKRPAPVSPRW
jgi:hypothetical protein